MPKEVKWVNCFEDHLTWSYVEIGKFTLIVQEGGSIPDWHIRCDRLGFEFYVDGTLDEAKEVAYNRFINELKDCYILLWELQND